MGEEREVEVMAEGVEGEAGVGEVGGRGCGKDATEAAAGEGRLGWVFAPDLDLVVGGCGCEVAGEGTGDPLDLLNVNQIWRLAEVGT